MKKFVHWMYENNFIIKNGIIYDTTDGCSRQFVCSNTMCLLSILAFTYRVIVDKCINYPGNIDGINGSGKVILKRKICMMGTK